MTVAGKLCFQFTCPSRCPVVRPDVSPVAARFPRRRAVLAVTCWP